MNSLPPGPNERSYWVIDGKLCAGAYPGAPDPEAAGLKIRALLDAGVRTFINLMEEDETNYTGQCFPPYAPIVAALASDYEGECNCLRFPIVDLSVPSFERMRDIQATIDESLAKDKPVYVHCWGGRGRTGTVIGIFLVRTKRATVDDYVDLIRQLRKTDAGGGDSPETAEQRKFVRTFCERLQAV